MVIGNRIIKIITANIFTSIIIINILSLPLPQYRNFLKNIRISKVNPQLGNIRVVDPEIKGQTAVAGQVRNGHTGCRAVGQRHGLAEGPAVYIGRGPVLRVVGPVKAGAVVVIAVEVLKTQRIGVVRHQLIVFDIIAEVQARHLGSGQGGTVAAVLELVV